MAPLEHQAVNGPRTRLQWLMARTQHSSASDFRVRVLILLMLCIPQILLGAVCYWVASGNPWPVSLFTVYAVLFRVPGSVVTREPTFAGSIVLNVIFHFGVFVFAIAIGMIADEIKTRVKSIRAGSSPLVMKDHVVVLNWNRHAPALLRQFAASCSDKSSSFYRKPIVLLTNNSKSDIEASVADVLKGRAVELHVRQGDTFKATALRKVSAFHARTIVLLHDDGHNSSQAFQAMSAVTVAALIAGKQCQHQTLVVQDSSKTRGRCSSVKSLKLYSKSYSYTQDTYLSLLQDVGSAAGLGFQLVPLRDRRIVHRLLAQTALQPGLASVSRELVQQGDGIAQIRWIDVLDSRDNSYGTLRRKYENAVICGYVRQDSKTLHLNPDDSVCLDAGDQLVALTRAAAQRSVGRRARWRAHEQRALSRADSVAARPAGWARRGRRILVLDWPPADLGELALVFREFAPPGSVVTFLQTREPGDHPGTAPNVEFQFATWQDHVANADQLLEAGLMDTDTIVVGATGELSGVDAGAHVLGLMMAVHSALRRGAPSDSPGSSLARAGSGGGGGGRKHVVALLDVPDMVDTVYAFMQGLSSHLFSMELLLAEEFVAAILSQVAMDPQFMAVVDDLLMDSSGAELEVLHPSDLDVAVGEVVSFAEVVDMARLRHRTALGYVLGDGSVDLAPHQRALWEVQPGDRIVTITHLDPGPEE